MTTTFEPTRDIGARLSWAWAAAFFSAGVIGFLPNPLLGPDALFVTNGAHNLVHLATAAAFAAMATLGSAAAVRFMKIFGVVYLLVGVLGFVALGGATTGHLLGVVHINGADNLLHLGLGTGILASGLFAGSANLGDTGVRPRRDFRRWAP